MALGTSRASKVNSVYGNPVYLTAVQSNWVTCIDATGPVVLDAATLTNPTTQVTNSTTHIITRTAYGRRASVRLGYNANVTGVTPIVVALFGRTGTDVWQRLPNLNGDRSATLSPNTTTDERNTSLNYTAVDPLLHVFDLEVPGCEELLLAVTTAFAATGGTTSDAIVQMKVT